MNIKELQRRFHPFEMTMRIHGLLGWPAMTRKEMRIIKNIFRTFPDDQPLHIFEYGMGFSTIYFSRYLRKERKNFFIDAIDNNRFWFERVQAMIRAAGLDKRVRLHLREFSPFWEKPGWDWKTPPACGAFAPRDKAEHEYIGLPLALNKKFDVIFIDARFRRRCLETVRDCLNPKGFVIIHDAQKPHYQESIKLYAHSRLIDSGRYFPFSRRVSQLWVGSLENPIVDKLKAER